MIRITSAANARVKELLKLKKQSKYRQEQGVYLVEGIRMCKEAPIHEIGQIWVSDSFQEQHPEFANEFEMVRTFYEVPDEIFQRLSDTQHPQGVLCVMRQKRYEIGLILKQEHPLLMVLDHLQDPGNVGTILRAGEAAGVTGVILKCRMRRYLQSQGDSIDHGLHLPGAICLCGRSAGGVGRTKTAWDSLLCGPSGRKEQL